MLGDKNGDGRRAKDGSREALALELTGLMALSAITTFKVNRYLQPTLVDSAVKIN